MPSSTRAAEPLVSPTLAINEEVARRTALGLATVPLGFGEAGLPVLPELVARLRDSAPRAGYGPVAGVLELREAAAGYWSRRGIRTIADQVVAGPGTKPLLYALLGAIEGPVALPAPSWVSYAAQAALLGRHTVLIPTRVGEGGVPDPDLLDAEATTAGAAGEPLGAVIVTLPDNPTGTLASASTVAAFCKVAERHGLLVISDEIYRDLLHDAGTPFVSPAELLPSQTVVTTGLSKNLAVGGWRIGVARFPRTKEGAVLQARVTSIASEVWSAPAQPVQLAAAWALTEPGEVQHRIRASADLHGRIASAVSRLLKAAGVEHPEPTAGFYLFADFASHRTLLQDRWHIRTGAELAQLLLREFGVATLPASAFGLGESVLSLRLATSLLAGDNDEQRELALASAHPESLPWVAAHLHTLAEALHGLLS